MIGKKYSDLIEIKELEELETLKNKNVIKQLHLNFAERKFIISGIKKFAKVIHELCDQQRLDQLHTLILDFSKNEIGSYGCELLVKPMKRLYNIKRLHLNLQWNDITQQGTKYLGFIIGCYENIHDLYLNLWGNDIGNLGIHNFFKGMDLAVKSSDIDLDALFKNKKNKKSKTLCIVEDIREEDSVPNMTKSQTQSEIPADSLGDQNDMLVDGEECKINNENIKQDNENEEDLNAQNEDQENENEDEVNEDDEKDQDSDDDTNDNIQKIEKLYTDNYKLLATNLAKLQKLTFNFKFTRISDLALGFISNCLLCVQGLKYLDFNVSSNKISSQSIDDFTSFLKGNGKLQELKINYKDNSLQAIGAEKLSVGLQNLRQLIHLKVNIQHNNIKEQGAIAIVTAIKGCEKLESLSLGFVSNFIQDKATSYIAMIITPNLRRLKLGLGSNNIWDTPVQAIMESIKYCTKLEYLNIDFGNNASQQTKNSLNLESALYISDALINLKDNLKRLSLNLFWNRIQSEGCKSLINAINSLKYLEDLNLNAKWNRIEENFARKSILPLNQLTNLRKIKLEFGIDNWVESKELTNRINQRRVYKRQFLYKLLATKKNQNLLQFRNEVIQEFLLEFLFI